VEVGWEVEHKARVNNCYSSRVAAADSFSFVIHLCGKRGIGTEWCRVQGEYIEVEREKIKNINLNIYNYIFKYIYKIYPTQYVINPDTLPHTHYMYDIPLTLHST
jgi:hypothetical protein